MMVEQTEGRRVRKGACQLLMSVLRSNVNLSPDTVFV